MWYALSKLSNHAPKKKNNNHTRTEDERLDETREMTNGSTDIAVHASSDLHVTKGAQLGRTVPRWNPRKQAVCVHQLLELCYRDANWVALLPLAVWTNLNHGHARTFSSATVATCASVAGRGLLWVHRDSCTPHNSHDGRLCCRRLQRRCHPVKAVADGESRAHKISFFSRDDPKCLPIVAQHVSQICMFLAVAAAALRSCYCNAYGDCTCRVFLCCQPASKKPRCIVTRNHRVLCRVKHRTPHRGRRAKPTVCVGSNGRHRACRCRRRRYSKRRRVPRCHFDVPFTHVRYELCVMRD
jgi:hypothetical protein